MAMLTLPFGLLFCYATNGAAKRWPWPLRCCSGGHGSLHAVQQVQSDLSSRSCWLVAENGSKCNRLQLVSEHNLLLRMDGSKKKTSQIWDEHPCKPANL